ncbi:MAG: hypothetical protein WKF87_04055 [Chryseolinea sp.]
MNKLLIGIAIGLLLGLFGYYSLTFFSSSESVSNDFARVTIKNESGRNAKKVLLKHGNGIIETTGLSNKDEIRFIFRNMGENSYKIIVTFDNDLTLSSNPLYIERGYRGTEIIKDFEIITENNW